MKSSLKTVPALTQRELFATELVWKQTSKLSISFQFENQHEALSLRGVT